MVLAAAVLPALAACGASSSPLSSHSATASSGVGYPLITGKVAIYVQGLPRLVVASGHAFVVQVVMVNGLGHAFAIPGACNGWLEVGLESRTIKFPFLSTSMACSSLVISPGITRASRSVITTYPGCSEDLRHQSSPFPACTGTAHDQAPVLPPGPYRLVVETSGVPRTEVVSPVDVRVVHE